MSKVSANKTNLKHQQMDILKVTLNQANDSKFKPVRKVPRTYQSIRAKSVGPDGIPIHFESKIEHDVFLLLRFEHEIEYIVEQPIKIDFLDENRTPKSFTPDLLIHYVEDNSLNDSYKPTLIEIKYQEEVEKNPIRTNEEISVATQVCNQEGWEFKLITDKDINYSKLKNIKFLRRFEEIEDRTDFDYRYSPTLLDAINKLKTSTPKLLIESITDSKLDFIEFLPYLWHLIRWNQIKTDLNKPLNMNSKIWHR